MSDAQAKLAAHEASIPFVVRVVDSIMAEMHQQIGEGAEMFRREVEVLVSLFTATVLSALIVGSWSYTVLGLDGRPNIWPLVPWFMLVFLLARFLPR